MKANRRQRKKEEKKTDENTFTSQHIPNNIIWSWCRCNYLSCENLFSNYYYYLYRACVCCGVRVWRLPAQYFVLCCVEFRRRIIIFRRLSRCPADTGNTASAHSQTQSGYETPPKYNSLVRDVDKHDTYQPNTISCSFSGAKARAIRCNGDWRKLKRSVFALWQFVVAWNHRKS